MSVQQLGNRQGFTRPGTPGATNPFPYQDLSTQSMRRLAHTRRALLSNKTLDYAPTDNDNLYDHRNTYDNEFTKNPRLYAALSGNRLLGMSADVPTQVAQGTTFVDRAGVTWTFSPNTNVLEGSIVPTAGGQVTVPAAGADNIGALALFTADPGLTAQNWIAINYVDANNMIRVFRQSATNIRVERVVASTPTTELDTTIVAATDPIGVSALGIRRNGTICAVFLNGRKIASFTLSGAAQAIVGALAAFQASSGGRQANGHMEVYNGLS